MTDRTPDPRLSSLSSTDLFLVTLFGEASGEPVEGQIAVAHNFKNRLESGRWGDSYHDVLLGWAQYSCLWPTLGGRNHTRVLAFAEQFSPLLPAPPSLSSLDPTAQQLAWVTKGVVEGLVKDNTFGALHYYAVGTPTPSWARGAKLTTQKGRHLFYSGVK